MGNERRTLEDFYRQALTPNVIDRVYRNAKTDQIYEAVGTVPLIEGDGNSKMFVRLFDSQHGWTRPREYGLVREHFPDEFVPPSRLDYETALSSLDTLTLREEAPNGKDKITNG